MKDFLKIFFLLISVIAAFLYGKSYGEAEFKESEEYQALLSPQKSKVEEPESEEKPIEKLAPVKEEPAPEAIIEKKPAIEPNFDFDKYKTFEWLLMNADTKESALRALDRLKVKSLAPFLKNSTQAISEDFDEFLGSYRGNIIGETGQAFGSLVINLKKDLVEDQQPSISGDVIVYREGREIISQHFNSFNQGLKISGLNCLILDSKNNYYQLYKIKSTGQVAGYFYERLQNGTTKVIGVFALNRVDQFQPEPESKPE